MFIGHFAPAFAARALTSEAPKLGTLFVAAQLVDIGFFLLVLGGIEQFRIEPGATAMNPFDFYHYPYTHSLLGTAGWALGFAFIVWLSLRNTVAATWAALVVLSHWLLDYVSHRPDLTLAGGEKLLGLGLWNHPVATIAAELALFAGAFWWYLRRTRGPSLPPLILAVVYDPDAGAELVRPTARRRRFKFACLGPPCIRPACRPCLLGRVYTSPLQRKRAFVVIRPVMIRAAHIARCTPAS